MHISLIAACVVVAVFAAPTPEQANALKELAQVMKDPNVSAADKKAKFLSTLDAFGGDLKSRYEALLAEAKNSINALPSEDARNAAQKLQDMYESGDLFGDMKSTKEKVEAVKANLSDADKESLKGLEQQYQEKFKALFKEFMPAPPEAPQQ